MVIFFGIFAILFPVAAGVLVWKRFDQIFLKTAQVDSNDNLPTYLKKLAAVSLTTGFLLFVCFQLLFLFGGEA
jgi:hypothetical protein